MTRLPITLAALHRQNQQRANHGIQIHQAKKSRFSAAFSLSSGSWQSSSAHYGIKFTVLLIIFSTHTRAVYRTQRTAMAGIDGINVLLRRCVGLFVEGPVRSILRKVECLVP